MSTSKTKTYHLDGDVLQTILRRDSDTELWFEDYIDFETEPRYTPNGRRWRSVTTTDCPHADARFRDCGTCPMLKKQQPKDLIGVCFHEELRNQNIDTGR